MRRIKMILAGVAAVATMAAMASPAMAQVEFFSPDDFSASDVGFCTLCEFRSFSGPVDHDFLDDVDGIVVVDADDVLDGRDFVVSGFDSGTLVGGTSNIF